MLDSVLNGTCIYDGLVIIVDGEVYFRMSPYNLSGGTEKKLEKDTEDGQEGKRGT